MTNPPPTSVSAATCKCGFCPRCSKIIGEKLREKLKIVFAMMEQIQMWTLTIDPSRFASPRDSWRFVNDNKLIGRLVRQLRHEGLLIGKHYVCVMEFHESGWPHWHIIFNTQFMPKSRVQEIWNRLGTGDEDENFGFVAFSKGRSTRKQAGFENPRHAANYITKYITKPPRQGWPEWVLKESSKVRRFSTSHKIFQELGHLPQKKKTTRQRSKYKRTNSIEARIKKCGNSYRFFQKLEDGKWHYKGDIPHKFEDIKDFFCTDTKTLLLPQPNTDPYCDMLFWSWIGESSAARCTLENGNLEPVDWAVHPEQWLDLIENTSPFQSAISLGEVQECQDIVKIWKERESCGTT